MSDEETKLPAGASVEIVLRRRRRDAPERAPAGQEEPPRSIVPTDDEPSRYLHRAGLEITFYDLGTRLRSVPATDFSELRFRPKDETTAPQRNDNFYNEYVEMEWEAEAVSETLSDDSSLYLSDFVRETDFRALEKRILGQRASSSTDALDPFGTTSANVTGRQLANCMPLAYDCGGALVDLVLRRDGADEKRYLIGQHLSRGFLTTVGTPQDTVQASEEWDARRSKELDATERWNPHNLSSGVAHATGVLKPKDSGGGQLKIEAALVYEPFATDDPVTYKITRQPSYTAEEVSFPGLSRGRVRVFLKPQLRLIQFFYTRPLRSQDGVQTTFFGYGITARLPVYTRLPRVGFGAREPGAQLNCLPARGWARSVSAFFSRSPLAKAVGDADEAATLAFHQFLNPERIYSYDEAYEGRWVTPLQAPRFNNGTTQPATRVGLLVGAISLGSAIYYVWLRRDESVDLRQEGQIKYDSITAPLAHGISSETRTVKPATIYTGDFNSTTRTLNNPPRQYQP